MPTVETWAAPKDLMWADMKDEKSGKLSAALMGEQRAGL